MKNETSAWFMLSGAVLLGALTATAVGGCRPAREEPLETPIDLDLGESDLGDPVGTDSHLTAPDSNVTTGQPAPAPETPFELPDDAAPREPAPSEGFVLPDDGPREAPEEAAEPLQPLPEQGSQRQSRGGEAEPGDAQALVASRGEAADDPEAVLSAGGDWPQWGGTRLRNNTPSVENVPLHWNIGRFDRRTGEWDDSTAENIKWVVNLGSQTYGNPVVAGGKVYVGTNNGAGYLPRYPADVDLGVLLCFDEETGEFLWQHSSEKLPTGRVHDWPLQGICSAPLVEGNRLWFVTSRGEVRCLDTEGFYDDVDDGPVTGELAFLCEIPNDHEGYDEAIEALDAGKLTEELVERMATAGMPLEGDAAIETETAGRKWIIRAPVDGHDREMTATIAGPRLSVSKTITVADKHEADVIWVFDMMKELGVSQHNMCSCSVTALGDLLFVHTGNGLDESHINLPAPEAPSFICMDKNTGEVLWTDRSPGTNILHGQWSSPTVAELGGVPQALFAGGDGWLYSFKADGGQDGNPELLWKFDCNPKETKWILGGAGTRNNLIGTPVVYDGLVYIAVGQDPEHGEGDGHLWCIDPTLRGDVSPQLAMKIEDGQRVPIPHKRIQAVEPELGEVAVDNPNSAVVWHYAEYDQDGDGEIDFEEQMHRTIGTVAIRDDRLYVIDLSGIFHCLDAKGTEDGQPIVHYTHDMLAQAWGSPLIAGDYVFIADEDGDVAIFEHEDNSGEPIEEINMGTSIYTTPVIANGVLYISTKDKLFAIEP